jgi:D-alanyl-lipoteichoic acid acyltransferase DltB (MBOAT superfamily)
MLFNSYGFLFAFLPLTLAGYCCLARYGASATAAWLAAASLFFYGWWDSRYLLLLGGSILFNYALAGRIAAAPPPAKKRWLTAAIGANLLLLAYYKYANFFLASVAVLAGTSPPLLHIVLPVGISFFTFTQIAYLVDTAQGKVHERHLLPYVLFVTYFPHLIAGPVLHHKQMMPQFADADKRRLSAVNCAAGISIFIIGLAKKVLLADSLAPQASAVFDTADVPSLLLAWGGVLAYAFQLYFDFSGYSDMAIGLSRLFGIRLPLNFDSPYKAGDIAEFWRRWHMSLSRFLRDYLYIPLGGSRRGPLLRYRNLMLTMVLGGLWHGAGWNFAIWGGLHGLFLIVHQGWVALSARLGWRAGHPALRPAAVLLTFLSVCCAWVFFRAPDLAAALRILKGMCGTSGIGLPDVVGHHLGPLQALLEEAGVVFFLGGGARFTATWSWVAVAALIAFCLPNTQQIVRERDVREEGGPLRIAGADALAAHLRWAPSPAWALGLGLLGLAGLMSLSNPSEFLYFQF